MTAREYARQCISGLIDFGRILGSKVEKSDPPLPTDRNTVRVTIEELDLALPGQDLWGHMALLCRPADPDDPDDDGIIAPDARAAEVLYIRRQDELVGIACRDTRWQVSLEKGETVVRALGSSAAIIRLKPDGTIELAGADQRVALEDKVHASVSAALQVGAAAPAPVGPVFQAVKEAWDAGTGGLPLPEPAPPAVPLPVGSTKVKAGS